jgi:hypothetical protein
VNRKNLDKDDFMETKFPSLPRKISFKARWSTPQGSQRAYIQPLGRPRRGDRSIHSSESRRTKEKHRGEADDHRKSSSYIGDGLAHALAAMVGPAW